MWYIIKYLILYGLSRLLISTQNVLLVTVINLGIHLLFSLLINPPTVVSNILYTVVSGFIIGYIYFWLLKKFQDSTLFYIILIVGGFFFLI
jgi:hypothetical protein